MRKRRKKYERKETIIKVLKKHMADREERVLPDRRNRVDEPEKRMERMEKKRENTDIDIISVA